MAMIHFRNCWYVAAFGDELPAGGMLARTYFDEPVVLFRDADGQPRALADRCPHRFAPLSMGTLCEDGRSIQCGYHGLRFGSDGACVHNPFGDGRIPKAARVRAYAVSERAGLIWLWAGDPGDADPGLIPDWSVIDASEDCTIRGYLPTACHYQLLVDNILDLTHADYLHAGSLGSGALTRATAHVEELSERSVRISWLSSGDLAPKAFDMHLARQGEPTEQWTEVTWAAPSCMLLRVGATLLGEPRERGVEATTLHIASPESEGRTHYWYWSVRNFAIDPHANAAIKPIVEHAFSQQDKPMLEAQQRRIGTADFWSQNPVLLASDAGAVRVRRKLDALIRSEAAAGTATA